MILDFMKVEKNRLKLVDLEIEHEDFDLNELDIGQVDDVIFLILIIEDAYNYLLDLINLLLTHCHIFLLSQLFIHLAQYFHLMATNTTL
jgi:hypothetical protein